MVFMNLHLRPFLKSNHMQAKSNPLKTKSFQFALDIVAFTQQLNEERNYVVAKQLLKSGTSIGANIHEAQTPESKNDFVHKLKIAAKEASETDFWLMLCKESPYLPEPAELQKNLNELQRMLSSSISTCKSRM
jgi:four helix bundle protein